MPGRMIWHDTRLAGSPPAIAPNTFQVNGTVALGGAIAWIATYAASQGGLDELIVLCHGYESAENVSARMSNPRLAGGFGLQICREGLDATNASAVARWKPAGRPLIRRITIYACGTAETGAGNENTRGDGRRFMGEVALHSGAYVVAGQDAQAYNPESVRPVNPQPIDFGEWEGPVFLFDPDTGRGRPFTPGPMA